MFALLGVLWYQGFTMPILGVGAASVFALGAGCSERFGRVRTAVFFGLFHQAGELWLYLGPPRHFAHPALWVGLGLCLGGLAASAFGTAKSTAGVELFPTQLRVTMMGWVALAGAIATGATHLLVAALVGPLGSLSMAIALLSLTGVAGIVVFGLYVDETRGLSLEEAALEEEAGVVQTAEEPLDYSEAARSPA